MVECFVKFFCVNLIFEYVVIRVVFYKNVKLCYIDIVVKF